MLHIINSKITFTAFHFFTVSFWLSMMKQQHQQPAGYRCGHWRYRQALRAMPRAMNTLGRSPLL